MTDEITQELRDTAIAGAKSVRAFLAYQGENQNYFQKARVGAVAMSAYTRHRATQANMIALVLTSLRQSGSTPDQVAKLATQLTGIEADTK